MDPISEGIHKIEEQPYQIFEAKRAETLFRHRGFPHQVEAVARVIAQGEQHLDQTLIMTQIQLDGSACQREIGAALDCVKAAAGEGGLFFVVVAGARRRMLQFEMARGQRNETQNRREKSPLHLGDRDSKRVQLCYESNEGSTEEE